MGFPPFLPTLAPRQALPHVQQAVPGVVLERVPQGPPLLVLEAQDLQLLVVLGLLLLDVGHEVRRRHEPGPSSPGQAPGQVIAGHHADVRLLDPRHVLVDVLVGIGRVHDGHPLVDHGLRRPRRVRRVEDRENLHVLEEGELLYQHVPGLLDPPGPEQLLELGPAPANVVTVDDEELSLPLSPLAVGESVRPLRLEGLPPAPSLVVPTPGRLPLPEFGPRQGLQRPRALGLPRARQGRRLPDLLLHRDRTVGQHPPLGPRWLVPSRGRRRRRRRRAQPHLSPPPVAPGPPRVARHPPPSLFPPRARSEER
mmetsp:Transcript_7497/g.21559  ORF Transcript_7497/g.21559 Transcript_7497/m.21559 type:complete len:310 (-) Transcript_7497:4-933(-)